MKLNTFGTVLRYALDREAAGAKFYQEAASSLPPDQEAVFTAISKAKAKRRQIVERARQENVVEMVLAPIVGLDGETYEVPLDIAGLDASAILDRAGEYEQKTAQFYLEAGPKLNTDEIDVIFKRLARENGEHRARFS